MSRIKGKSQKKSSLIIGKSRIEEIKNNRYLKLNFKYFCNNQGQSFQDWEQEGLLSVTMYKFIHYSSLTMDKVFGDKFKIYDSFPINSDFTHPNNVPEDAEWASMHIKGKECVIGHILNDVFYVVFLDKNHVFYITDKKNT
ncbi:MAG: hypothetical protein BWK80_11750 [Desulfobacteraceae bacterium IS3]|nr:MAG: hypothetical protein BWK80_11750 [Desulfobacteraceae bacterium IS3]